ncbi:TonB family protein [Thalassococcus sp. CAU 1522]|uniref:TonB family protein n=1 Tax=Thalassococcus arenae TaxID=2851652 RepID=A0ABS6N932_9RHOB|nr:TonB family protein [Thalassococcus arenae]MBV2360499.1 TonB family protein [Thalassococcus arenae]
MIRVFEGTVFLTLAGAVHLAALTLAPVSVGGAAQGAGGRESVTLAPATETLAALVAQWTAPPEVSQVTVPFVAPAADRAPTPLAPPVATALHRAVPAAPRVAPARDSAPRELMAPAPRSLTTDAPQAPIQPEPATALPLPETPLSGTGAPARKPAVLPSPETAQGAAPFVAPEPPSSPRAPTASPKPEARPAALAQADAPAAAPRASRAEPRKTAAGSGRTGQSTERAVRDPAPKGADAGTLRKAQAAWGAQIQAAVNRAVRAPSGGVRGRVTLQLTVTRSGKLSGLTVARSSGNRAIDNAAVKAARRARLPVAPKTLTNSSYTFSLPLNFTSG